MLRLETVDISRLSAMQKSKAFMSLADLTVMEERFLAAAKQRPGFVMELHHRLRDAEGDEPMGSLVDGFGRVHPGYAALIHDLVDGLEAMKRALFLTWFATVGDEWGWGIDRDLFGWAIYEIFPDAEWEVVREVECRCQAGAESPDLALDGRTLDAELKFMLRWYYSISPGTFHFDHFLHYDPGWNWERNLPYLYSELWSWGPALLLRHAFTEESVANRSHMGRYFRALLDEDTRLVRIATGDEYRK